VVLVVVLLPVANDGAGGTAPALVALTFPREIYEGEFNKSGLTTQRLQAIGNLLATEW
jgi:hypothetical protein